MLMASRRWPMPLARDIYERAFPGPTCGRRPLRIGVWLDRAGVLDGSAAETLDDLAAALTAAIDGRRPAVFAPPRRVRRDRVPGMGDAISPRQALRWWSATGPSGYAMARFEVPGGAGCANTLTVSIDGRSHRGGRQRQWSLRAIRRVASSCCAAAGPIGGGRPLPRDAAVGFPAASGQSPGARRLSFAALR